MEMSTEHDINLSSGACSSKCYTPGSKIVKLYKKKLIKNLICLLEELTDEESLELIEPYCMKRKLVSSGLKEKEKNDYCFSLSDVQPMNENSFFSNESYIHEAQDIPKDYLLMNYPRDNFTSSRMEPSNTSTQNSLIGGYLSDVGTIKSGHIKKTTSNTDTANSRDDYTSSVDTISTLNDFSVDRLSILLGNSVKSHNTSQLDGAMGMDALDSPNVVPSGIDYIQGIEHFSVGDTSVQDSLTGANNMSRMDYCTDSSPNDIRNTIQGEESIKNMNTKVYKKCHDRRYAANNQNLVNDFSNHQKDNGDGMCDFGLLELPCNNLPSLAIKQNLKRNKYTGNSNSLDISCQDLESDDFYAFHKEKALNSDDNTFTKDKLSNSWLNRFCNRVDKRRVQDGFKSESYNKDLGRLRCPIKDRWKEGVLVTRRDSMESGNKQIKDQQFHNNHSSFSVSLNSNVNPSSLSSPPAQSVYKNCLLKRNVFNSNNQKHPILLNGAHKFSTWDMHDVTGDWFTPPKELPAHIQKYKQKRYSDMTESNYQYKQSHFSGQKWQNKSNKSCKLGTQQDAHFMLRCKPCAHYFDTGCLNGDDCDFCHHGDHRAISPKKWKKLARCRPDILISLLNNRNVK